MYMDEEYRSIQSILVSEKKDREIGEGSVFSEAVRDRERARGLVGQFIG